MKTGIRQIHPDHPWKHVWDGVVAAFIVSAAVDVPARIALGYPVAGMVALLDYATTVVFTLDIFCTFLTARLVRGRLDTDRRRVARHYLRSWFAVDVVSAVPVAALLAGFVPAAAVPWLLLLRMARLTKLPVMRRSLHRWEAAHLLNPNIVRLGFLACGVALVSHWVACGWILVGRSAAAGQAVYVDALYWSVTTLTTVGYGDITPEGARARIYTMGVMCLGVVIWAVVIGSIASLIRDLDHARIAHNERTDRIESFLRYHDLPSDLRRRVRDHLHYLWESRLGFDERSIMAELPLHLRTEVQLRLLRDMIRAVPFLRDAPPEFLRRLASRLDPCTVAPDDVVLREGEIGDCMYFLDRGLVEVSSKDGAVHRTQGSGSHFGEISIVYERRRTASVRALEFCDLYSLRKSDFEEVLRDFPEVVDSMRRVADKRAKGGATDSNAPSS